MLGVINVLGLILTAFGATFALPLVTALITADGTAGYFLASGVATAGVGYGIAPARVVLVDIRAVEVAMLAVEHEAIGRRPGEPAHAEVGAELVLHLAADHDVTDGGIKLRRLRRPQHGLGQRAGLIERHRLTGGNG